MWKTSRSFPTCWDFPVLIFLGLPVLQDFLSFFGPWSDSTGRALELLNLSAFLVFVSCLRFLIFTCGDKDFYSCRFLIFVSCPVFSTKALDGGRTIETRVDIKRKISFGELSLSMKLWERESTRTTNLSLVNYASEEQQLAALLITRRKSKNAQLC